MKKISLVVAFYLAIAQTCAADFNALVLNKEGKPVADAVVLASNVMATAAPGLKDAIRPSSLAEIVQIDKEFAPYVTAISVGTQVNFPNKDAVKHHVYSFSPSKKFDLPLYSGTSASPVRFDNPGVVVIGCNIHDWMIGYIYIAETPYFAKTNAAGKAMLKDLPAGKYQLRVWHPDSATSEEQTTQQLEIKANGSTELVWHLDIKPRINPHHNSMPDMNSY